MQKAFFLFAFLILSIDSFEPDIQNSIIFNEFEFKCKSGKVTYQINNPKN